MRTEGTCRSNWSNINAAHLWVHLTFCSVRRLKQTSCESGSLHTCDGYQPGAKPCTVGNEASTLSHLWCCCQKPLQRDRSKSEGKNQDSKIKTSAKLTSPRLSLLKEFSYRWRRAAEQKAEPSMWWSWSLRSQRWWSWEWKMPPHHHLWLLFSSTSSGSGTKTTTTFYSETPHTHTCNTDSHVSKIASWMKLVLGTLHLRTIEVLLLKLFFTGQLKKWFWRRHQDGTQTHHGTETDKYWNTWLFLIYWTLGNSSVSLMALNSTPPFLSVHFLQWEVQLNEPNTNEVFKMNTSASEGAKSHFLCITSKFFPLLTKSCEVSLHSNNPAPGANAATAD